MRHCTSAIQFRESVLNHTSVAQVFVAKQRRDRVEELATRPQLSHGAGGADYVEWPV